MKHAAPVLGLACALAVALVTSYLLLGGASYAPAAVADPCLPRAVARPSGTAEAVERVVLSTADGAACAVGASREELILALRGRDDLSQLAKRRHIDEDALEQAIREGLSRGVDEAEAAGWLDDRIASVLRTAAERLPIGFLISIIRDGSALVS